jgi:hypothetical protein
MSDSLDLTGYKINRWFVLAKGHKNPKSGFYWVCKCECGKEKSVRGTVLKSGKSMSCGCYAREMSSKRAKPGRDTPEYGIYHGMLTRCTNAKTDNYENYGGRGIKVCDRWLGEQGFDNFMTDMGPRPSPEHTLDRYPDNENGIYEPKNCRWATQKEQMRNVRYNVWIEYEGEKMILADWAIFLGVNEQIIRHHLKIKTAEETIRYIKNEYKGRKKIRIGRFKDGILVETYNNAKELYENGFGISNVYVCLKGKSESYKGYNWKYIDEPDKKTA